MCGNTFTIGLVTSSNAPEQQGGIIPGIDTQAYAAPFQGLALPGAQILQRRNAAACRWGTDLQVAGVEPEFAQALARERDRDRDRVVAGGRLLDEADHLLV